MSAGRPGPANPRAEAREELEFHLDRATASLIARGWTEEDARAEAFRRFGPFDDTIEYCAASIDRRQRREGWAMRFDHLRRDFTFAIRTLRRSPGYTAVVVATLAIAIGANATIFAAMSPYFLRPLPYDGADRLTQLGFVDAESGYDRIRMSVPQAQDIMDRSAAVERVEWYHYTTLNLADDALPDRVQVGVVSPGMFQLLGTAPVHGRALAPDDAGPSGRSVVVIGHGLWRARYAADPEIVGKSIRFNGTPHTVVGVMGPEFTFPFNGIQAWTVDQRDPLAMERSSQGDLPVALLAEGWTREAARADLDAVQRGLAAEYPEVDGRFAGISPVPLRAALNFAWEPLRAGFGFLIAAVGFLYLLACVNVAGLGLARTTAREPEIAVRRALGAGRARLVRQLGVEALVLSVVAGTAGILLAWVAVGALAPLMPGDLFRVGDASLDPLVLIFTAGVTLLAPIVFGLVPAFSGVRGIAATTVRSGTGSGDSRGRLRGRRVLVVAQAALAVMLVTGGGMAIRGFLDVRALDLGFEPRELLVAEVSPPAADYSGAAELDVYFSTALERLGAIPGVSGVGSVAWLPMNHETLTLDYQLPGGLGTPSQDWPFAYRNAVDASYFDALGMSIEAGRGFQRSDDADAPPVVVVSRAMAERLPAGADPVGSTLYLGYDPPVPATIVGIVSDVQHSDDLGDRFPMIYQPLPQASRRRRFVVLSAAGGGAPLTEGVRRAFGEVDPSLPVTVRPMTDIVGESTIAFALGAALLSGFAVVGLALAALGLAGLVAYSVARRRRELGVRVALGASPQSVRRLVVGDGVRLAGVGAVVGVGLALALAQGVAGVVPDAPTPTVVTLISAALLLIGVTAAAAFVPAMRTRVDPGEALRSE